MSSCRNRPLRARVAERAVAAFLLLAFAGGQLGCATKFVAKPNNPLKPVNRPGWDPGELSEATKSRLATLGIAKLSPDNVPRAIAALEPSAASDLAARRAVIEVALAAGMKADAKFLTNRGAAGLYLCAVENASDASGQGDAEFQKFRSEASRYAVSRLANLREIAADKGIGMSPVIPGPTRGYQINLRSDTPGAFGLERFKKLMPVDRYRVVGAREPAVVEGVGTPLVGKLRGPSAATAVREFQVVDDSWLPFTATVEFGPVAENRRATFTIYDRKNVETVNLGSRRETLAADFSTPFAVRVAELQKENYVTLGILGFLRGDRFFESTGLYPLEFPRQDKIPVVFVHGLISDPTDWRFLHNALLADPAIREKYQFWAFNYPTSMAVPWSSAILRRDLARVHQRMNPNGTNPKLNQMVLIGHSMGGLLSRMQISQSTPEYYHSYFKKPVDQLRIPEGYRATVRDMFAFSPNHDVTEAVFICVPHQGSTLATNWIGKIGRIVARLPLTVLKASVDLLTLNADALAADASAAGGTSIDSLSPGGKFARTLQLLPMDERVKKHSIIGDRGKGGDVTKSSDGVVPYWSSHIDGIPETIIPSSHSGPEHDRCAVVVKGLLIEHWGGQEKSAAR